jgi:hypothetical protein
MTRNDTPVGQTRRTMLLTGAAIATTVFGAQLASLEAAKAAEGDPMFMFVHVADDIKADQGSGKLRLVNVNQQVLFFSDRPERLAGHMKLADYLTEWVKGKDNFGEDPPNATLSVYEPDQPDNTLAVVEITDPVVDGSDLVYSYKLLDGAMPKAGGAATLFIDAIGVGGGVGVGYHGVGVGARGVGVL